jgi:hypothetical protein
MYEGDFLTLAERDKSTYQGELLEAMPIAPRFAPIQFLREPFRHISQGDQHIHKRRIGPRRKAYVTLVAGATHDLRSTEVEPAEQSDLGQVPGVAANAQRVRRLQQCLVSCCSTHGSVNECWCSVDSFRVRQTQGVRLWLEISGFRNNEAPSDVDKSLIVGAYVSYLPHRPLR